VGFRRAAAGRCVPPARLASPSRDAGATPPHRRLQPSHGRSTPGSAGRAQDAVARLVESWARRRAPGVVLTTRRPVDHHRGQTALLGSRRTDHLRVDGERTALLGGRRASFDDRLRIIRTRHRDIVVETVGVVHQHRGPFPRTASPLSVAGPGGGYAGVGGRVWGGPPFTRDGKAPAGAAARGNRCAERTLAQPDDSEPADMTSVSLHWLRIPERI